MISVSKFLRKVAVTSRNIADIDYLLACILFIPTFHPPAESWPGTLIHLDLKYMRSSDLRHWGRCENICAGHTMRLSDTLSESLWCRASSFSDIVVGLTLDSGQRPVDGSGGSGNVWQMRAETRTAESGRPATASTANLTTEYQEMETLQGTTYWSLL